MKTTFDFTNIPLHNETKFETTQWFSLQKWLMSLPYQTKKKRSYKNIQDESEPWLALIFFHGNLWRSTLNLYEVTYLLNFKCSKVIIFWELFVNLLKIILFLKICWLIDNSIYNFYNQIMNITTIKITSCPHIPESLKFVV